MGNRDSMIFYRSFYESGMLLKPKDRALLYEAILKYQFTGEKISLPDAAMAAWVLIEPILESNNQRYENGQKGKEHGAKGGRPAKQKNPIGDIENNPIGDIDSEENETPNKEEVEDKDVNKEEVEDRAAEDTPPDGETPPPVNYQNILESYNAVCKSYPRITKLSDARRKAIKARLNQYTVEEFRVMFKKAEASSFMKGSNSHNWTATFDWMLKDANMAKILDGNYDNKNSAKNNAPVMSDGKEGCPY